ncbi:SGNH/GDSL hydrolase family protein [Paraburkholderia sp. BL10I2N1]|uniref:SGNH/GDSL hydrolase family protein n=1 Tax=Paraburkholderia sp. BL10I2N1 TaxID=1938796 RepID=UPI00105FA67C|nr:SGNH/GDSL hydrolase family protein [Paraburkholderia sp. BL10I2N1]TDN70406.1 lysophospholipase L1-like esterase [Paraburkholderia sp. BL10I2N1]
MALNNPTPPAFKPVLRTMIPLGDSITQANSGETNGYWQFGNSFAEKAAWRAGLRLISNAGIFGQKSYQIAARLQSDVLAYSPDCITIMAGTNDVPVNTFGTVAAASYMNYIEQIVHGCINSGVYPFIVVPPAKTGVPDAYMNRYFYYLLAERYGVPLVDACTATINAADPLGGYVTAYTIDGTHPNAAGTDEIARPTAALLRNPYQFRRLPYFGIFPETTDSAPANMLINGNFVNFIGPNLAGWTSDTGNGTVTYEPTLGYPYTGKTFVYTKPGTANSYLLNSNAIGVADGGFAAGDTLAFSGCIATSGMTVTSEIQGLLVQIMTNNGSGWSQLVSMVNNGQEPEQKIYQHEFVIPAGVQYIQVAISASIPGTYRVNNLTLVNKSRYQRLWQPGKQ